MGEGGGGDEDEESGEQRAHHAPVAGREFDPSVARVHGRRNRTRPHMPHDATPGMGYTAPAMTSAARHILELVRALCVLGLVFLNFAHTPAAAASGTTVFCGERPAGDGGTALVRDP